MLTLFCSPSIRVYSTPYGSSPEFTFYHFAFTAILPRDMAKKRRKKRQSKDKKSNLLLFPFLIVVAAVIIGVVYWKAPEDKKRQLRDSYSNVVETVKGELQDRLEKISETSELANGDRLLEEPGEKTETATGDRMFSYAGLPKSISYPYPITVLTNQGYIAGYCEERKNPAWVSYRVFKLANAESPPRPSRFTVDTRTTSRVRHDDYTRSRYDRGHMAPNYAIGSRYGATAQRETFYMSNIVPQKPDLNRRIWRMLEERIAKEYAMNFEEVWIITGPVYDEKKETLDSEVEIPDAFFKIIIDEVSGKPRVLAFLIDQDVTGSERFSQFLASVDFIEGVTGLDFLAGLEDSLEDKIEERKVGRIW